MIDWMAFFTDSIDAIHEQLVVVLEASGCREGWLQGELFRAGRRHGHDLKVNEYGLGDRKKADLSCGDPPTMLAEIKIVGSWYFPKMQFAIEADVERMRQATAPNAERYMILVIPEWPDTDGKTTLGRYLDTCRFSDKCTERRWAGFHVKIWGL